MTPFRCTIAALERQEPLFATASRVDRWLLVEHPSAWSGETVPRFRLAGPVLTALEQLAAASRARLVLIRRPGGARAASRRLFLVDSRPGREQVLARTVDRDEELVSAEPPGSPSAAWTASAQRLLLVCTHGRHDPCCAIWGRPVVETLASSYPAETWECTHIGGDRFAPNLVVLPEGFYFGRVPPVEASGIVSELDSGRLDTRYLRGRSSLSLPVQAAQYFARTRLTAETAGDLMPVDSERPNPAVWRVRLRSADHGHVVATVRRVLPPSAHRLTCRATESMPVPAYELLELSTS